MKRGSDWKFLHSLLLLHFWALLYSSCIRLLNLLGFELFKLLPSYNRIRMHSEKKPEISKVDV
jgi:hypothetical protein